MIKVELTRKEIRFLLDTLTDHVDLLIDEFKEPPSDALLELIDYLKTFIVSPED